MSRTGIAQADFDCPFEVTEDGVNLNPAAQPYVDELGIVWDDSSDWRGYWAGDLRDHGWEVAHLQTFEIGAPMHPEVQATIESIPGLYVFVAVERIPEDEDVLIVEGELLGWAILRRIDGWR